MKYTLQQQEQISREAAGKRVQSLEYDSVGRYWVMTFDDGSEINFRFMAELA